MLETETYAVLSTAHLKPRTVENIASFGLVTSETEHRIRVRIPQPGELPAPELIPSDLAAAIKLVERQLPDGYGIMFDCDGPIVPELPTYDW